MNRREFVVSTSAALLPVPGNVNANGTEKQAQAYRNAALPIPDRVHDLLRRMSLGEKLGQLMCAGDRRNIEHNGGTFSPEKAISVFPDSIGHVASPGWYSDRPPSQPQRTPLEMARYCNDMQRWAVERTRLGIPILFHEEALHGHRGRGSTSFPQAIALASSWDIELVEAVFAVAGKETRARGAQMVLSPVVDVARDPRWGRTEETYGEDPHLCGEIGLAAVRGFQGRSLPLGRDKVFATLKHFVADSEPAGGTNAGPVSIGERALRDIHLKPFRHIVGNVPLRSVMVTYNEIDGVPCTANSWLLTRVLRNEWAFEGMVVSDYDSVKQLMTEHQFAQSLDQAAKDALMAGVDVEFADPEAFPLLAGHVTKNTAIGQRIDEAVARVLRVKFEGGFFEKPYVDLESVDSQVGTKAASALALSAAERSAVLLKNNGVLPIDLSRKLRICVLGTHARDTPLGGYSGTPARVVSVLDGLLAEVGARAEVVYSEGVRITEGHDWYQDDVKWTTDDINIPLMDDAVRQAGKSDLVVMVLGSNEAISREAWTKDHKGDRASLDLPGRQNDLAERIFNLKKPVVVILLNGSPLSVNAVAKRADALIEGWYLGQETGTALARIMTGKVNPGGKLPISMPRSVGQIPIYYNHKPTALREYVDEAVEPLFPFGFGLSFTTFEISVPRLPRLRVPVGEPVEVLVDIVNTGLREGDEVVQLYIHHAFASVVTPVLELKAFQRVALKAGEGRTLKFSLNHNAFELCDHNLATSVEPGHYEIAIGSSSQALKTATLELTAT